MKVWIVQEGDYSDKCIIGVFSTETKAGEYIKAKQVTNELVSYSCSGYDLDESKIPESIWFVVDECGEITVSDDEYDTLPEGFGTDAKGDYRIKEWCYIRVHFNLDREVMEKAVRDKYAFFKAQKEGIA